MSGTVTVERRGYVTTIAIARPDRRNALNASVADEIVAAMQQNSIRNAAPSSSPASGIGHSAQAATCNRARTERRSPSMRLTPGITSSGFKRMDACRLPLIARASTGLRWRRPGSCLRLRRRRAGQGDFRRHRGQKVGLFPMMILPYLLRSIPYKQLMELCSPAN